MMKPDITPPVKTNDTNIDFHADKSPTKDCPKDAAHSTYISGQCNLVELRLSTDLAAIISCSYISNYNAYDIMQHMGYTYDTQISTDQRRVYIDK